MPLTKPQPPAQLGTRPSTPVTAADVAAWETRTDPRLGRYVTPAAGEIVLDDVLPELDDYLADPRAARTAVADELAP